MYYYYLELYNSFDVSKIISLCKDVYNKYIKYVDIYDKDREILNRIIKDKDKEYSNIEKIISFNDFIDEVAK